MRSWLDSFVAIDTETTGFGPEARILSVGFVHFRGGSPVETRSFRFFPDGVDWNAPDVQEALSVNGLSKEMLWNAPPFWRTLHKVLDHLNRETVWVGHYAKFDVDMLTAEVRRAADVFGWLHYPFLSPPELLVDTILLDQALGQSGASRKLADVCARWEVPLEGAHTAVGDAMAAGMLAVKIGAWGPTCIDRMRKLLDQASTERQAERAARHAERNQTDMKIRMIGNNVLLKRAASEAVTPGGIIIPDSHQKKSTYAEVVAVGPGAVNKQGVFVETTVKPGDTVLMSQWTGAEMKHDGQSLLIAGEDEILAVVENDEPRK
jgi:chaperonin GroES